MQQYVVDAFTDHVFSGNPAAVCVMEQWLPEETMMQITKENNLSETAFAVKENDGYRLRWFTPGGEIDLFGHATSATAFVFIKYIDAQLDHITFHTMSGDLVVKKAGDLLEMDFPAYDLQPVEISQEIIDTLGIKPQKVYMGRDLLCVVSEEEFVRNFVPDLEKIKALPGLLLHITAQGKEYDCVSRSFAPKLNVAEDPVCGSGHCHIVPYWLQALQKDTLVAYQASARGGVLYCQMNENRVVLRGKAALYAESEIYF